MMEEDKRIGKRRTEGEERKAKGVERRGKKRREEERRAEGEERGEMKERF